MKVKKWVVGLVAGASLAMGGVMTVALAPAASAATTSISSVSTQATFVTGDRLYSPNRQFFFTMNSDGNAVEYNSYGDVIWQTGTYSPGARFVAQSDGNAVVYAKAGGVVWPANTGRMSATQLVLGDDGNLVLRNANTGVVAWANGGRQSVLLPNERLTAGQQLTASYTTNQVALKMQASDGNLVLYRGGTPIWSAGTQGHPGAWATLQADGNFVVYDSANKPIKPAAPVASVGNTVRSMTLQDDGNLVIATASNPVAWNSKGIVPVSTAQAKIETAIAYAEAQKKQPYVLGGENPGGWDCSGLTMKAYAAAGINIGPHSVQKQYAAASSRQIFPLTQAQRGDLVFWGSAPSNLYHVAIYLGNGMIIAAPKENDVVKEQPLWGPPYPYVVRPTA